MTRIILPALVVLVVAIGGGAASVWYALAWVHGVGAQTVGLWTAYPKSGTPQADPYSKARFAREAELPLGGAEGLAFIASRDTAGDPLRRRCTYRIEGNVPVSRFWTLYASQGNRVPVAPDSDRPGVHSRQILRRPDSSFEITADRRPAPGNWLALDGAGPMALVLTFYDTPIAGSIDVEGVDLPQIYRIGCDG